MKWVCLLRDCGLVISCVSLFLALRQSVMVSPQAGCYFAPLCSVGYVFAMDLIVEFIVHAP